MNNNLNILKYFKYFENIFFILNFLKKILIYNNIKLINNYVFQNFH